MYSAKIICDSVSETGKRLTTFEITFPRIVLAEAKTHRMIRGMGGNIEEELWLSGLGINDDENLSRNSASSRAIPVEKMIKMVLNNPFIPEQFPMNSKGMQPQEYITKDNPEFEKHVEHWLFCRNKAVEYATYGREVLNWAKQLANRLLEPFMWYTSIITATEFSNFFKLRTNENAQYEIRRIADLMYYEYIEVENDVENCTYDCDKKPKKLKQNEWHMPLIFNEDYKLIEQYIKDKRFLVPQELGARNNLIVGFLKKVSVARCARVSYLTYDDKRDIEKDLELFEKLKVSGHWSPFEHVATPLFADAGSKFTGSYNQEEYIDRAFHNKRYMNIRSGNFIGWKQYRKEFQDENCTHFRKE